MTSSLKTIFLGGFRSELRLLGHVLRAVTRYAGHARLQSKDEKDANLLQTPPAPYNEIVLCNKPQSRRQGPEATITKDWLTEESPAGNSIFLVVNIIYKGVYGGALLQIISSAEISKPLADRGL